MNLPRRSKKRTPLGTVKPWTEEELDRLSIVTPEDILLSSALWRQNAGALANLLDARPTDAEKPANPTI